MAHSLRGVELQHDVGDRWLPTLRLNNTDLDTPLHADGYVYAFGGLAEDGSVPVLANEFALDRDVWSGELQVTGRVGLFGREATVGFGADWNENEYSRRGVYAYADGYGNIYDGTFPAPDTTALTPGFATDTKPITDHPRRVRASTNPAGRPARGTTGRALRRREVQPHAVPCDRRRGP